MMDATSLLTPVILDTLDIVALLFLLWLLRRNVLMSDIQVTSFRSAVVFMVITQLAEIACILFDSQGPSWRIANIISNVIGFSCSVAIPFILSATLDNRLYRRRWLLYLTPIAFFIISVISAWTGWVFYVSQENAYSRGPLFALFVVLYIAGLFLLVVANIHQAQRLGAEDKAFLLLLTLMFIAGSSIQLILPDLHVSWPCVTLSVILYYVFERELQFKYDLLTGLHNRASFIHDTERDVEEGTYVMQLDVDDFKKVNDAFGHKAGDDCLRAVASVIDTCFSPIGCCYRIGGDEFLVIGKTDPALIASATEQMTRAITSVREKGGNLPFVSYGTSVVGPGEKVSDALQRADEEMYSFKGRRHQKDRSEIS